MYSVLSVIVDILSVTILKSPCCKCCSHFCAFFALLFASLLQSRRRKTPSRGPHGGERAPCICDSKTPYV